MNRLNIDAIVLSIFFSAIINNIENAMLHGIQKDLILFKTSSSEIILDIKFGIARFHFDSLFLSSWSLEYPV